MIVKGKHIIMRTTRGFTILALLMVFVVSCNKQDESNNGVYNGCGNNYNGDVTVSVFTMDPCEITTTTVICGAQVTVSEGLFLSGIGICWSTQENPTAIDSHFSTHPFNLSYTCTITDLVPTTVYHVRAYAFRDTVYYYGEDKCFITDEIGSGNGSYCGHDYVNLGLPSGTLWATCNVGANAPEDYGDYFAWGETTTKTWFSWNNYKYCYDGNYHKLTKYCQRSDYGNNCFTDNLTTLQSCDDAATANWGNGWCIPSTDQWQELRDNTTCVWTTQNGVYGRLFTAKNLSTLFLPATSTDVLEKGNNGYYWSSIINVEQPYDAVSFDLEKTYCEYWPNCNGRSRGISVRPVCYLE